MVPRDYLEVVAKIASPIIHSHIIFTVTMTKLNRKRGHNKYLKTRIILQLYLRLRSSETTSSGRIKIRNGNQ